MDDKCELSKVIIFVKKKREREKEKQQEQFFPPLVEVESAKNRFTISTWLGALLWITNSYFIFARKIETKAQPETVMIFLLHLVT